MEIIMPSLTSSIIYTDANNMLRYIKPNTIDAVITSPPYPMIAMWDYLFNKTSNGTSVNIEPDLYWKSSLDMLDSIWKKCYKVLKKGGICCINMGDATRRTTTGFQIFPNSAETITRCRKIGFKLLPSLIWNKPSNGPASFMGSGTLPVNAYITNETEDILIFRKGGLRDFKSDADRRRRSAFFSEERNEWFTNIWKDRGSKQSINGNRLRSAAFPFSIPHKLINMFSIQGDTVLDPFIGTGTTLIAAVSNARRCVGFEVDKSLLDIVFDRAREIKQTANDMLLDRLRNHRMKVSIEAKYFHSGYKFNVKTNQETDIRLRRLEQVNYRVVKDRLDIAVQYN
jgi:DNA modification methylase